MIMQDDEGNHYIVIYFILQNIIYCNTLYITTGWINWLLQTAGLINDSQRVLNRTARNMFEKTVNFPIKSQKKYSRKSDSTYFI